MESISGQGKKSVLTGAVPMGSFNHPQKSDTNVGIGDSLQREISGVGPSCTGWTDEKHRMYLSFMETSFVNRLSNHECSSALSPDALSRGRNDFDSNHIPQPSQKSSGQFKVLQSGYWKKLDIGKSGDQLDHEGTPHVLWANQWVQHFGPLSNGKQPETKMSNLRRNSMSGTSRACLAKEHRNIKVLSARASTKICPTNYLQNSVDQNAEVSDQNFIDESYGCELDEINSSHKKKRLRTEQKNFFNKDQVVPSTDFGPVQSIPSQRGNSFPKREKK